MKKYFYIITLLFCTIIGLKGQVIATNQEINISNIQHTRMNKTINLSWEVDEGKSQADMYLRTPETKIFKFIATIDTFSKKVSFQVNKNGNYVVRFIPTGGGNDIRYSFVVSDLDEEQKDITTVPKTGTTENILLIIGVSIFLYILYWYRKNIKASKR